MAGAAADEDDGLVACHLETLHEIVHFENRFDVQKKLKMPATIYDILQAMSGYQAVIVSGVEATLRNGIVKECIDKDIIDNIIIVLSIMLSMLFAMLSIINGYQRNDSKYVKVLDETNNSIMFQSVLCVVTLIISFAQFFVDTYDGEKTIIIVSFVLYYLMFVIILNTFIILKRMKALYDNR